MGWGNNIYATKDVLVHQALEQERSRLLRQIESLNEEKAQLQDQLNLSQSLLAQTPPRTTGEGPDQILNPTSERVDEFAPMVTNEQSVEEMASGKVWLIAVSS